MPQTPGMTKTPPACRISVAEAGRDSGTLRTTATLLREALCLAIQGNACWDFIVGFEALHQTNPHRTGTYLGCKTPPNYAGLRDLHGTFGSAFVARLLAVRMFNKPTCE